MPGPLRMSHPAAPVTDSPSKPAATAPRAPSPSRSAPHIPVDAATRAPAEEPPRSRRQSTAPTPRRPTAVAKFSCRLDSFHPSRLPTEAQAEKTFEGFTPQLEAVMDEMNRDGRRILLPLLGAAALVLLIACGNVAALLLVRGLQRQQEYAVRSAMGMGRVALLRQVSTESLLLALLGGTFGVGLAFGVVKLFKLIAGHAIPRLEAVTAGWAVLAWGLGAAVLAAVFAGVFPALRTFRLDPMEVLKNAGPKGTAGLGERRLLRGVTMVQ